MPLLPFLLLIIILLPDLYIWFSFVRGQVAPVWSALYWLPLLLTVVGIACFVMGYANHTVLKATFFLFLTFALPKILFSVFSLVGRGLAVFEPRFSYIGIGFAVIIGFCTFIMSMYGFVWGWKRVVGRTVAVEVPQLPAAFEAYKIIQISDLHLGTFGHDTELVNRLVEEVNALKPDLIVFTGDLVNIAPEELKPFTAELSRLSAPDGVLSILGNHDYSTYHPNKSKTARQARLNKLIEMQRAMGWQLLRNESYAIVRGGDTLVIAGVDNVARPPFPSYGDLKKAMAEVAPEACVVLLSHDPTHWRREVLYHYPNIKLTLSGHTHAMQFKLGAFSPSQWIYDEWGGHYEENGQHLNVSTGAGSNIPFRFGAQPEYVELVLKK
jgi:predicted MPP superfamily phosphohydrolase